MISLAKNRKRNGRKASHPRRRQFEHLERRDMFAGLPGLIALDAPGDLQSERDNVALTSTANPTSIGSPLTPPTRFGTVQGAGLVTPGSSQIELTDKDNGAVINVVKNDIITIRLPGNPSTGYSWKLVDETGKAVALISREYYSAAPETGMVGAPGTYVFEFKAVNRGTTTLQLAYVRNWDKASAAANQFAVTITVSPRFRAPVAEVPVSPWNWQFNKWDRLDSRVDSDHLTAHMPEVDTRGGLVIDQIFSEDQPIWRVPDIAIEALTPVVYAGSTRGSAELDVLGYSANAIVDFDLSDGEVGLGVEASIYSLAAKAEGQFETDAVNVGGVKIVGRGEGSTSVIVGVLASADLTLGVQGLELSSRIVVGEQLTADGQVTADIGGLEATAGGEAIVYVVAGLDAGMAVTTEGVQLEATAFAGDRFQVTGEAELGGVGVETTAEVWAGVGCTAQADCCFKDGKFVAELSLGAALGVGGKLGVGFSIDVVEVRDNVVQAAERAGALVVDAAHHVDDAADRVGAFVTDTADHASKLVHSAGNEVKEAANQVANKVEQAANNVSKFFKKWF